MQGYDASKVDSLEPHSLASLGALRVQISTRAGSRAPRRALHARPLVGVFHSIRKPTQVYYAQTNLGHSKLTNGSKDAPMAPRTHLEYPHEWPCVVRLLRGGSPQRTRLTNLPGQWLQCQANVSKVVRLLRGGRVRTLNGTLDFSGCISHEA